MSALLTTIVLWLAANFGLPENHEHPHIEFAAADAIAARHFADTMTVVPGGAQHVIVSAYSDVSRTIYLPQDWRGETPAELSVLVHEMVHHLQNVAGLRHECEQARERLAFAAQERWLALFGRSLASEFGLDAFSLLVRTSCDR